MERVKVIHVITRMDLGGAQQNTLHTVRHLDRRRYETVLVAGPGGPLESEVRDLFGRENPRAVILEPLIRRIHPALDLLALLRLTSLFLNEKPLIVHTHSSKAGILARLAAWIARVPVVIHTYHGFGFNDYQPPATKTLYVWAERLCCLLADALVFVSKSNEDYAKRHKLGDPKRYALIRSGVRLSDFPAKVEDKQKKKASLGLGAQKLLVVSIGNLKPQKNPADFVAMAHKVALEVPEAEFLFIGDGPLRRRLECQILASGLSARLALPGWRRDAAELLACADVFVLNSLWEGLPRALIEAMKTGLPAVCYATDGVTDVLKDGVNGCVVPVGNISALARRVIELLKDEDLRRRLGGEAQRSIGAEFDIDEMVRAQERLYERLLNSHG